MLIGIIYESDMCLNIGLNIEARHDIQTNLNSRYISTINKQTHTNTLTIGNLDSFKEF